MSQGYRGGQKFGQALSWKVFLLFLTHPPKKKNQKSVRYQPVPPGSSADSCSFLLRSHLERSSNRPLKGAPRSRWLLDKFALERNSYIRISFWGKRVRPPVEICGSDFLLCSRTRFFISNSIIRGRNSSFIYISFIHNIFTILKQL